LTLPARRELGALPVPPQRGIRSPSCSRRCGSGSCPEISSTTAPAESLLVVLDADVCFEHDRSRRPAGFRRLCGDLRPADLA
jgi:hypothetical protein